jgi:hypothetical protein
MDIKAFCNRTLLHVPPENDSMAAEFHATFGQENFVNCILIFLFNEFIKVGAACISMHIMAAH